MVSFPWQLWVQKGKKSRNSCYSGQNLMFECQLLLWLNAETKWMGMLHPQLPQALLLLLCKVPVGQSTMWWCSIWQLDWNVPCPLPLPDSPPPCQRQNPPTKGGTPPYQRQDPPPWTECSMTGGRQGGQRRIDEQGRIDDITDAARDFALQLPWALLLVVRATALRGVFSAVCSRVCVLTVFMYLSLTGHQECSQSSHTHAPHSMHVLFCGRLTTHVKNTPVHRASFLPSLWPPLFSTLLSFGGQWTHTHTHTHTRTQPLSAWVWWFQDTDQVSDLCAGPARRILHSTSTKFST